MCACPAQCKVLRVHHLQSSLQPCQMDNIISLLPLRKLKSSERLVKEATPSHIAEPDVKQILSDFRASVLPSTPGCLLIIVKILKDTN